jgi:hypothetical protein
MGRALEILTGHVTAPSTTFTAWTMAAGNSLTIRNAPLEKKVSLLQAWADNQGAGTLRIRSPRLHDNVQGIRLDITASDPVPLLAKGIPQVLIPQDTLIAEHTGSATSGDIETGCLLVYYEDLPGVDAKFIDLDTLKRRLRHVFTVENTLALGTAGGYSGEEAINAQFDLFKANTEYALLGYLADVECACVRWRGADTGNLGIGGPGNETLRNETRQWFIQLTEVSGLPLIPVFNSANRAGILIDGAQDENGADVTVTSIFAELGV